MKNSKMLLALASEIPALEAESEGKLCGGFCELGSDVALFGSDNGACSNNGKCNANDSCTNNDVCNRNGSCHGTTPPPTPSTPDKPTQTPTKCTGGCGLPAFGTSVLF